MSVKSWLRRLLGGAPISPTEAIAQLFEQHGIAVRRSGETVLLPDHGCSFQTRLVPHETLASCQLDFGLLLPDGRRLVESFGGFGKNREAAVRDAVENFTRSSLHVILRGVLAPGLDDQVEVERWTVGAVDYRVTLGLAVYRGQPPEDRQAPWWFPHLEAAIKRQSLPDDLCWIRFYYAHAKGEMLGLEVLLNNEHWTEVEEVIGALDWPSVSGFYGQRLFMVLRAER